MAINAMAQRIKYFIVNINLKKRKKILVMEIEGDKGRHERMNDKKKKG
jgi:hypothetical protein